MGAARVVVVMGVSGAGKTTAGEALAESLDWPFLDADALHPEPNVAKMAAGQPLTDTDRTPWLVALRRWISGELHRGTSAVLACSALKVEYRAQLQVDARVRFVFLQADADLIAERLSERTGHFFPPALLDSQFATLEPPADALVLDAARPVADLVAAIRRDLRS